jgi:CRP/FNR family transcriptional regulator, cyclic AMP receptor protein
VASHVKRLRAFPWIFSPKTMNAAPATPRKTTRRRAVCTEDWRKHPFLQGLTDAQIAKLAEFAMQVEFEPGKRIFHEGDIANRFYLLLDGQVSLETEARDGKPVTIKTLGRGDVLGWSWLFPPYQWNFTARAVTPVKAVFFYGTWLREECETDLALGFELLKRMSQILLHRLQATRRRLVDGK